MRFSRAIVVSSMALALGGAVAAQADTVTEKTTTYEGVVSDVNPGSSTIVLRSETAAAPTTYTFNKETIFTDASGKVVSYEVIKNSPVTVQYTRDGDRMIVTKVVQRPTTVRKETTTTTTEED